MRGNAREATLFMVAFALMIIQRIAVRIFDLGGWESGLRRTVFVATTAGVGVVAWKLRTWIGAWVVLLGLLMNLAPTLAHGGLMPISIEKLQESGIYQVTDEDLNKPIAKSKDILLRRDDIRFEFLSDRYILTLPLVDTNIYSAGDFVLFAGLCIAVAEAVSRIVRGEQEADGEDSHR